MISILWNTGNIPGFSVLHYDSMQQSVLTLGTLSSQDGSAIQDIDRKKWILIFSYNFTNGWTCLPSLKLPHLNTSLTHVSSVKFKMET